MLTYAIKDTPTQEISTHVGFDSSQFQPDTMELKDAVYSENSEVKWHAEKGTKSRLVVREIETSGDDNQEKLQRRRRGAQVLRRTSRLARILIWTFMITLPLFFISKLLLNSRSLTLPKTDIGV